MLDITEATCFPLFSNQTQLAADVYAAFVAVLAALLPAKLDLDPVSCLLFKLKVEAKKYCHHV